MKRLAEIIRRFFVVVLWLVGLVLAASFGYYFASITEIAGGEGQTVAQLAVGAIIFLVIIGITQLIHKKIINYIFMLDTKKDEKSSRQP